MYVCMYVCMYVYILSIHKTKNLLKLYKKIL